MDNHLYEICFFLLIKKKKKKNKTYIKTKLYYEVKKD